MDPISWSASLTVTVHLVTTAISVLSDIESKPEDVRSLILELSNVLGLLQSLRSLGEKRQEEAEWPKLWRQLLSPEGPILELYSELDSFMRPLSSARDLGRTESRWKSSRGVVRQKEMQNLLSILMRARSMMATVLTFNQS